MLSQGSAYGDTLLASGASELLPTNTQIFSSTVRYGRWWYFTAAAGGFVALCLLGAAAAAAGGGRAGLSAGAFVIIAALGGVLYFWARRASVQYEAALGAGNWHQGVIVFPSGDVVVRSQGVFADTDKTIESVYFSRADVEHGCALHRCGMRRYLKLYYLGIDATAAVITICETDLRDDVTRIADFINEMKVRGESADVIVMKHMQCSTHTPHSSPSIILFAHLTV